LRSVYIYINGRGFLTLLGGAILFLPLARLLVYIILNGILGSLIYCGKYRVYYYATALNGNLTIILW
jgi:hypothetical protein